MGRALDGLGVKVPSLDPDGLMARASRKTGLSDFGDPWFQEPFRLLIDALENEANMSTMGRIIARQGMLELLENRLRITDTFQRHPELEDEEIKAPIFIVGMPRAGTTILHELMAQDPANRVPMTWEVRHPWPPPERESHATDPRIAKVAHDLAQSERIMPGFHVMHPMGAEFPQECVNLMAYDFASLLWHSTHNVPSYYAWLNQANQLPVYRSHRRLLQYFQWKCPGERWVLKAPYHMWFIDHILEIHPDARIVHTHRDPLRVMSSLTSLLALLQSMATEEVDRGRIARDWTKTLRDGLKRAIEARDRLGLGEHQIFDMHFQEFMRDEIAMVRRIYDRFGLELGPEAEARMRAYLEANRLEKRGKHRYPAADELDEAEERERYAFYFERYDIEPEPRS